MDRAQRSPRGQRFYWPHSRTSGFAQEVYARFQRAPADATGETETVLLPSPWGVCPRFVAFTAQSVRLAP